MKKNEIRGYIVMRHKLGIEPRTIHTELVKCLGGSAPCLRTVYYWVERYKKSGEDVEDKHRCGRPITGCTRANIERIHKLVEENPHISLNYLEELTSLSHNLLHRIIHKHLKLRKLSSRWIPHDLTDAQKLKRLKFCEKNLKKFDEGKWRLCDVVTGDESWIFHRKIQKKCMNMEWVAPGGTPGTVVKRNQFEKKNMICVFFKSSGHLLVDVLKRGKTIDNVFYTNKFLKPLAAAVRAFRPVSGLRNIKLLHDNARPHIHKNVKNYIKTQGITLIEHPPYSPDLAPSDFWLFDEIKRRLPEQVEESNLKRVITAILKSIPRNQYLKTFHKYIERMRLCVTAEGDYFEHLLK